MASAAFAFSRNPFPRSPGEGAHKAHAAGCHRIPCISGHRYRRGYSAGGLFDR